MESVEEIASSSIRGSVYLFLGTTASTVLSAIASILFGRLLGPGGYGLYSLSLTPPSLLLLATNFGLNVGIVKYISEYQRRGRYLTIKRLILKALLFQGLLSIFLSLIVFMYSDILSMYVINRPEAGEYVKITSLYLIGVVVLGTLNQGFIGLNRMDSVSTTMFIQALTKVFLGVGLVVLGFGIWGAVVGHSLSYIIALVIGLALIYKIVFGSFSDDNQNEYVDRIGLKDLIIFGFPVYIGSLSLPILGVYRNYLMSLYTSDAEIGNFMAAMNLSSALIVFVTPIVSTLFSSFSRLDRERELNIIRDLFRYSVKYSSVLVLPVALYLSLMADEVISLLYGSDYVSAPLYLVIAISPYLLIGLGHSIVVSLLNGLGETKVVLKMFLIGFFISLPLYPMLIILYGVLGILLAILVSAIASLMYSLIYIRRNFNISIQLNDTFRVYVAAFSSLLVTYVVKYMIPIGRPVIALILYGIIFLIIYMSILPTVRGITRHDISLLINSFKKLGLLGYPVVLLLKIEERLCKE